jgi:hypothetical protein
VSFWQHIRIFLCTKTKKGAFEMTTANQDFDAAGAKEIAAELSRYAARIQQHFAPETVSAAFLFVGTAVAADSLEPESVAVLLRKIADDVAADAAASLEDLKRIAGNAGKPERGLQ